MTDALDREKILEDWKQKEVLAEKILPLAGALYRDFGVNVNVCGTSLLHRRPVQIIEAHRRARELWGEELDLKASLEVIETLLSLEPGPARVDVAKVVGRYRAAGSPGSLAEYTKKELAELAGRVSTLRDEPQDVVLYGFGRIGRLMARVLIDKTGGGDRCRLRGIVVRPGKKGDLQKRASLLQYDSVHGAFQGTVEILPEQDALVINGNLVHLIRANAPEEVDYTAYGIKDAIVVDNTGIWRDREGLGRHLQAKGVASVILTAPGKGDIPNIVFGVNHETLDPNERIVSAASCTTNAIVPVLKTIHDTFGIVSGHMETIHAYTNDQNLIDNFHKKHRRGRAAALNMVITETGAAEAVAKTLPELTGKLTGNAIRVPTPNVSLAVLTLNLGRETSVEEINDHLRRMAIDSPLQSQIEFATADDIVSSDLVGNPHASIVDANATIVSGSRATIYTWYDNEFGYTCQVMRLLQHMSNTNPPNVPR
ncbi:MAG: glyceraldehyde-3-phosphate dehydrogenase [Myxococcales bacterium]|nr:glyceraldehyde-3-phosphate dehydrogenase [Myxococcales bacterium]